MFKMRTLQLRTAEFNCYISVDLDFWKCHDRGIENTNIYRSKYCKYYFPVYYVFIPVEYAAATSISKGSIRNSKIEVHDAIWIFELGEVSCT